MSSGSTSATLYAIVSSPSSTRGAAPKDTKELRHHNKNGKGFINPWPSYIERGVGEMFRLMGWRFLSGQWKSPDTTPPTVPVRKPEFLPTRKTPTLRATWLGHACYYVEFPSGLRVLFDPVFDQRCSPVQFMGPKRYTDMPCLIEDIPFIDAVIISHNHYDHLSHPTTQKIKKLFPNVHFFAPLGNKKWFTENGIDNMTELDWWETRNFDLSATKDSNMKHEETGESIKADSKEDIKAIIGCLPCQHTSARTPFDKAHTLWASWSVESEGKKVYFGGDTGYRAVPQLPDTEFDYDPKYDHLPVCPAFKEIGELRGPFDLGLIPIGAYDPRYIMSPMHANPYDSVNIFIDTKCKQALGIHWGTWVLTEEDVMEPALLLRKALAWKNLPETGRFDTCDIGESREIS